MMEKIVVFKDKNIRRTMHKDEWWFSVVDVVGVLSESAIPRRYWSDLKRQLVKKEGYFELYDKIVRFKIEDPELIAC